jgi:hypothetical protein
MTNQIDIFGEVESLPLSKKKRKIIYDPDKAKTYNSISGGS